MGGSFGVVSSRASFCGHAERLWSGHSAGYTPFRGANGHAQPRQAAFFRIHPWQGSGLARRAHLIQDHPVPPPPPPAPMKPCQSSARLGFSLLALVLVSVPGRGGVRLSTHLGDEVSTVPARIHLTTSEGRAVQPPPFPRWHDHFVFPGSAELDLPPGNYRVVAERGPEFTAPREAFSVLESDGVNAPPHVVRLSLRRLANLAEEGWWSGETHIHRAPEDVPLLLRAEDLHIGQVITWWNRVNPWSSTTPPPSLRVAMDGDHFFHPMAGEDERDGGALLFQDLDRPLPIAGATRQTPSSVVFAGQARALGARWIDAEKPFWWDFPLWVAHGVVDSVGIAHNHLQRGGTLDNEAWGRPRDRELYPGPQGNGRYTQQIYYHLLNTGLRLPPSAGSASGVLPNPVGYNRVYVHLDGELTYGRWCEGLKAGRSFVSNGPLLRLRANGELPGHVFQTNSPLELLIEGRLDSRDPIEVVELVRNGAVERVTLPFRFAVAESGWFLVRAVAEVPSTFRFASTAPWYVEIGGQPMRPRPEAATFFLDWARERLRSLETGTNVEPDQRRALLQPWREAETFWLAKARSARSRVTVTGRVLDAVTHAPIASRVYLRDAKGNHDFVASADPAGSAVRYDKQNWVNRDAIERHTTLSAHPWRVELGPGDYTVVVERGKEYRPLTRTFRVDASTESGALDLELPLQRWVNMAARGWYSGDTHVHRTLAELPNVALAEDVNVSFPLTYWTTRAGEAPARGNKTTTADAAVPGELVRVDDTHVFWPRNTEWEIFTVHGTNHTLGAVFALGHRGVLSPGAPPLLPVRDAARAEGALFDLDKHDWPWAMALVPLLGVDLYELSNNHVWRTGFGFTNWSTPAPSFLDLPGHGQGRGGNERDWLEYTHRTYWTLLNCGFRLRPTAGTASGVHPVPLGFGRVYVHIPEGFTYERWMQGLNAGRSFVTTGPMILADITRDEIRGRVLSQAPVGELEIIVNGEITRRLPLSGVTHAEGGLEAVFRVPFARPGTCWVALRCWEPVAGEPGRERFAHTAPRWFEDPGAPLRPRRVEAQFLVDRVREQIERSRGILSAQALAEYEQAQAVYEQILQRSD